MRAAWILVLVGCGRIAFDPLAVGDGGIGGDTRDGAVPLVPLTCNVWSAPLANVSTNADLVAAHFASGFAAAWTARDGSQPISTIRFDATGQPSPPTMLVLMATQLGALAELQGRVFLHTKAGAATYTLVLDVQLTGESVFASGTGIIGHGCVMGLSQDTELFHLTATAATVTGSYIGASVLGSPANLNTGMALDTIDCHGGTDHAHVGWEHMDGSCSGMRIDPLPVMPAFGGNQLLSTDCDDPRSAIIDPGPDTTVVVWRTGAGAIEASWIGAAADPAFQLSPTGRSARVTATTSTMWFAWMDTPTGELQIAHKTRLGVPVVRAASGVAPAGEEAYELLLSPTGVPYLAVLTASDIRFYELCE